MLVIVTIFSTDSLEISAWVSAKERGSNLKTQLSDANCTIKTNEEKFECRMNKKA